MRKGFLLKAIVLTIALAAVVAVIVLTMRSGFQNTRTPGTQTFFEQFIISGGPIVWFVLLPLSLVTAYLAAEHSLSIRRKKLLPDGIANHIISLIRRFGHRQLAAGIAEKDDFLSVAVTKAVNQGRGDWFRMRNVLAESLQDQAWALMRKIEWVNLIGNVSPMVGLFGTVFGMIKLFNAIVIAGGQPQPAQLAGGISIALVTTFGGLCSAIPALAIYGVFRNRIETLASDAVLEAENVMTEIMKSIKKQTRPEQPIREIKPKPTKTIRQTTRPL